MKKTMSLLILLGLLCVPALGQEAEASAAEAIEAVQNNLNIVWTCIAAFLVFFMQAGFAMLESGFTRAKNAVNILMKNLMDFSVGTLTFALLGFGLMFGVGGGLFGTTHFMLSDMGEGVESWNWTFLMFQTVFAATAATIVSGAMAERTKFMAISSTASSLRSSSTQSLATGPGVLCFMTVKVAGAVGWPA